MGKIFILLLLICLKLMGEESSISINYKVDEPLLGKGYYLTLSDIPVANYPNTVGYFSSVNIEGKNLKIEKDLKKIIIKRSGEVIRETDVTWEKYAFDIKGLDLGGLVIDLRWVILNRQKIDVMISEWNLEDGSYELEIEYIYPEKKDIQKMKISMPKFNPDIYLDFDYKTPILKKQEYNKKYLVVKKIALNDYDLEITKNRENLEGLKVILSKEASIEGKNAEENQYISSVKIVPLIEKYPKVFVEERDSENIFKNSKEIFIGLELPKDIEYNSNYKISGDILKVKYRDLEKVLIDKIIIIDGMNEVTKTIGITNWYGEGEKIYIDNTNDGKRYYEIESINEVQKNYKNLKIKIGDLEKDIDSEGDSEIISLENMKVKVEDGTVSVSFDELNNFNQGMELKYDILSNRNEIIDRIKLKFYMEN
ncbi:hypothetical protein [Cetobacterium sp.]|uniref:hypothetical protein n=1 Tax=Cetobacterium sp. TaxID=2071632 RepID=UPI003AF11B24